MAKGGIVGSFQDEMPAAVKCELIDEDLGSSFIDFFERDLASYPDDIQKEVRRRVEYIHWVKSTL